jgi:hypothetical protein
MSTKQELQTRVDELEAELKQRDEKIAELRAELQQAVEMVDDMRQEVEDGNAVIDSWIEVFRLEQDDGGIYQFDSGQSKLWDEHLTLLKAHNKLINDWNRFVGQYNQVVAPRPPGRPLAASDAQVADVLKRHKAGASLRAIAAATGLGLRTVRSILAGSKRTAELRKREFDKHRAADYRARKKARDALPKRITETRTRGDELVKAAKGLGASL